MKKIFLIMFFTILCFNSHVFGSFFNMCSCAPDETEDVQDIPVYMKDTRALQSELSKSFQQDIEQQAQQFVEKGDFESLDALLKTINGKEKTDLLSKKITVSYLNQKPSTTNLLNFAVSHNDEAIVKILINHGATTETYDSDGFSPLTLATYYNLPNMIELLVSLGGNINSYDANGKNALYFTARDSHVDLIPLLIKLGANVNLADQDGWPSLSSAVKFNQELSVKTLINHGADINLSNKNGFSPLSTAVSAHLPNMIELLVSLGANINSYDANGNTALYFASQDSYADLIPLFIKLGANVNLADQDGWPSLSLAVKFNQELSVKTLINHGADINLSNKDGFSPLTIAAKAHLQNMIELLVSLGANINSYDANGNTTLFLAAYNVCADIIPIIKLGADVNMANKLGSMPIHAALYNNNQSATKALLEHHVNINAQDSDGNTPLHIAIEKSYDNIAYLLIDRGADINIENNKHISPAEKAVFCGKRDMAKLLFKNQSPPVQDLCFAIKMNNINAFSILLDNYKTNPFINQEIPSGPIWDAVWIKIYALAVGNKEIIDICNTKNKNFTKDDIDWLYPNHYTAMHNHFALLQYFLDDCHIDINQNDAYGLTPLHCACMYGHYEIVDYLIEKKCFINPKSLRDFQCYKKESTPCDIAMQLGYTDIVNLLVKHGATMSFNLKNDIISDQTSHLALFIDFDNECPKSNQSMIFINNALSQNVRDIIKQKACPTIIIGQHILHNALQLSCSLNDWIIVEFSGENIDGYIIVPKRLIDTPVNSCSQKLLDTKMQSFGFSLSSVHHAYVDEDYVKQKRASDKIVEIKPLSSLVPKMLDTILMPRERYIYWGGHGKIVDEAFIGGLLQDDASKLFNILANKCTKMVYLFSCCFGGKNYKAVGDFSDMIVIGAATTEIPLLQVQGTFPINWRGFFNALDRYKDNNNINGSVEAYCNYFASEVFPHLSMGYLTITNIPHIKFPGKPFTLLPISQQVMLLDKDTIKSYGTDKTIILEDKWLLEVAIPVTKNSVEIKGEIPLFISGLGNNIFEKIYIHAKKDAYHIDLLSFFDQLLRPQYFHESTLQNKYLIKELSFSAPTFIFEKEKIVASFPQVLYDVVIIRASGHDCSSCCIFFSTCKKPSAKTIFCVFYLKSSKWIMGIMEMPAEKFLYFYQTFVQEITTSADIIS